MIKEARAAGLAFESHLHKRLKPRADARLHKSRKHIYRSKRPFYRPINHGKGKILIHKSVKERWDNQNLKYKPKNLAEYVNANGWPLLVA